MKMRIDNRFFLIIIGTISLYIIFLTVVIFIRIFTRWYGVSLGFVALKLIEGLSDNKDNNKKSSI